MSRWHIWSCGIEHEIWIFLINGIVCQMHEPSLHIHLIWRLIMLCRKSSQPLFIQVQSHWTRSTQKYVYPKVKLEFIDQKRSFHVFLNNIMLSILDVLSFEGQKNTSTLTISLWFYNVAMVSRFLNVISELRILVWENPRTWEEMIVGRVDLGHVHKGLPKKVLSGQNLDTWEVTDFLEEVHFDEKIWFYNLIDP